MDKRDDDRSCQARTQFDVIVVLCLLITALLFSSTAKAQNIGDVAEHFAYDVASGFYNSAEHRPNWLGLGILGGTAVTSYLAYQYLDDDIVEELGNRSYIESGEEEFSYAGMYAAMSTPFIWYGASFLYPVDSETRRKTRMVAEELGEALVWTFATSAVIKYSVGRDRPDGQSNSFPSAHTSLSFAAATILANHYPWYVGAISYSVATLVGFTRMDVQDHFLSDVLAGAGIGLFFGTAVAQFHQRFANKAQVAVAPLLTSETTGAILSWHF